MSVSKAEIWRPNCHQCDHESTINSPPTSRRHPITIVECIKCCAKMHESGRHGYTTQLLPDSIISFLICPRRRRRRSKPSKRRQILISSFASSELWPENCARWWKLCYAPRISCDKRSHFQRALLLALCRSSISFCAYICTLSQSRPSSTQVCDRLRFTFFFTQEKSKLISCDASR